MLTESMCLKKGILLNQETMMHFLKKEDSIMRYGANKAGNKPYNIADFSAILAS
jgi:hypothetical protein